jgi:hypothetical protein
MNHIEMIYNAGMVSYKVVTEPLDDGNHKALPIAIDPHGTQRSLVRSENLAEAEASRNYWKKQARRNDIQAD